MNKNMSLWDKLVASFDNSSDGFSARKLSAFTAVVVALVATFRFVDSSVIINVLIVWLTFALLCMGIITAEQVLKFYKREDNTQPHDVQPAADTPVEDPKI